MGVLQGVCQAGASMLALLLGGQLWLEFTPHAGFGRITTPSSELRGM
jgi:hypothetical protein